MKTACCVVLTLLWAAALERAAEAERPAELLQVGRSARTATFAGVAADGSLEFQPADGGKTTLAASDLVRWGAPAPLRSADVLVLRDGSRLALAPSWSRPSISFDGVAGEARTRAVGRVKFSRDAVGALLFNAPRGAEMSPEFLGFAAQSDRGQDSDQLVLANGDVVTGTLLRLGPNAAGKLTVTFDAKDAPVEIAVDRLLAVRFGEDQRADARAKRPGGELLIGLDDGTRIAATSLATRAGQTVVQSAAVGGVTLASGRRIASMQGFGERVAYLSDAPVVSYRHEPYLELSWDYQRDRSVLSQLLCVEGRTYLKGLGMHSASRITFDVDGRYQRLAASAAVDDAAGPGGSVVFRVFLRRGEQWSEAFASSVVRGGEPPQDVAVQLGDATQLALVVDYADRGDELDYANWLDARLERTDAGK